MTTAKTILGVVPGLQATALVGHNLKMMNMSMKKGTHYSPKRMPKQIIRTGVTNLLGIGLIGATASEINKL